MGQFQVGLRTLPIMSTHTGSISWTDGLARSMAAIVAEFLTGYYAPSYHLYRSHPREDTY